MTKASIRFINFFDDEELKISLYGDDKAINIVLGALCKENTPTSIYRKSVEEENKKD